MILPLCFLFQSIPLSLEEVTKVITLKQTTKQLIFLGALISDVSLLLSPFIQREVSLIKGEDSGT